MITFSDVSKTYRTRGLTNRVFSRLDFSILPRESLAICGANGAGKSTLLRLIAGIEHPTSGTITRTMRTSWPIGLANCFQMTMSGTDNARFIARIYGKDEKDVLAYVDDFAQLGIFMNQPVMNYSSGMASRLAFGVSLAVDFDCYIVDEVTAVGDARFRRRCEEELLSRRDRAALIMTSHDPGVLERYCTRGAVLYGGVLTFFNTAAEANEVHHALQMRHPALAAAG
ncbi:ABC transporter ATP-binding protein [Novosphingobium sp.]|uniref:ABC transporter ATP-binding protein n=1 Tax=Novosphingobium sp. TaxID=1874826 RepID=UPI0031CE8B98